MMHRDERPEGPPHGRMEGHMLPQQLGVACGVKGSRGHGPRLPLFGPQGGSERHHGHRRQYFRHELGPVGDHQVPRLPIMHRGISTQNDACGSEGGAKGVNKFQHRDMCGREPVLNVQTNIVAVIERWLPLF